jgi:predicted TIM-barrel fold metal-dependent hydrolase
MRHLQFIVTVHRLGYKLMPMIADAHCHFFSSTFLAALARELPDPPANPATELPPRLGWDPPGTNDALADRWVAELDKQNVARAALIASTHGDEDAVAAAVARHPSRFVGFFFLNPLAADAGDRARRAYSQSGLRCACLFPAMHRYRLDDERVGAIVRIASERRGAVFVHCGVLSVGVRKKLGIPSRFDVRNGDPLAVAALAANWPDVPFIIPHFGAGMLREALMAMDLASNVHLDTSSSNSWMRYLPGVTLEHVFRQSLEVGGASRLLFGTDSSFFPRGWNRAVYRDQMKALDTLGVSAQDQALITGGNFERLFPRTGTTADG